MLLEVGGDASKVIEFLQAIQSLEGIAAKHGHPGKDDLARYLRQSSHSLEKATAFVKLVWKIANPKEKKPTKKDAKVPEHLAAKCGFPSRSEVEWALLNSEPPLDQNAAVNLLCQLAQAHADALKYVHRYQHVVDVLMAGCEWSTARSVELLRHLGGVAKLRPVLVRELPEGEADAELERLREKAGS